MADAADPFAVLGLGPDADGPAVRRAFRARARLSHPDAGGDPEEFLRVNRAYQLLSTPEGRALAARRLRGSRPGTSRPGAARPAPARPGPARPTSGRPASPQSSRLSQSEQDRLVDEFFRSHPDTARRGGPPAPTPHRRGRGLVLGVVAVGAALAVVLLVPDVLPEAVSGWVSVLTG